MSPSQNEKNAKQSLEKYESQLLHIFSKYFIRYINDLKDLSDSTKDFQSILIKIPQWSNSKIDREYSKFQKYISKKYQIQSDQLLKIYNQIFILRIKMILFLFRKHSDFTLHIPELHTFWYKCLKHISKYFYDHPKISDSTIIYKNIKYIIELLLQKYTPISDIIEEEYNDEEQEDNNNTQEDNNNTQEDNHNTQEDNNNTQKDNNEQEYNKINLQTNDEHVSQHEITGHVFNKINKIENSQDAIIIEPLIKLRYLVDLENEFYKSPPKPITISHITPPQDEKIITFSKNT